MISFAQVTKKFGSVMALNEISFLIKSGEFVFVTGPSGSGKTTIVKLILGEISPSSGNIKVLERDLGNLKSKEIVSLRREIGVVWQDFRLIRDVTVFENVALTLRVKLVRDEAIKLQVNHVLEIVGLVGRENFFPSQLAGGELQRTCLARAMVGNPKILLADEPTGNLDPDTSWQIMNLLKIVNKQGTTVLMASHNTEIVNSMRQRVIHLERGKIVKDEEKGRYGR